MELYNRFVKHVNRHSIRYSAGVVLLCYLLFGIGYCDYSKKREEQAGRHVVQMDNIGQARHQTIDGKLDSLVMEADTLLEARKDSL